MVVLCLISQHFATCSLATHRHVVSDVNKRLITFTSFALNTLAPMLFYSHITCQKYLVFFSRPGNPSAFHHFVSDFFATNCSDLSDFIVHSTMDSRSIILLFSRLRIVSTFGFSRRQRLYFPTLCLQSALRSNSGTN